MISPEEMRDKGFTQREKFALWLIKRIKDYKFSGEELSTFSLTIYVPDYLESTNTVIPSEFLVREWDGVTDSPEYFLNPDSAGVFKDFKWCPSYGYTEMTDITVYFNTEKYTEKEKELLALQYKDIDITPLLNVRENLLHQTNVNEINLKAFDRWFSNIVNKHKNNLTDEEKYKHEIIFNEDERDKNYMYNGHFHKPYVSYLEISDWEPVYCGVKW